MNEPGNQRKGVKSTALVLALVALSFYVAFIAMKALGS